MKPTKVMLSFMITYLLTWLVLGGIGWALSDMTYKQILTDQPLVVFMVVLGWLPAVVVGFDVDEKLSK